MAADFIAGHLLMNLETLSASIKQSRIQRFVFTKLVLLLILDTRLPVFQETYIINFTSFGINIILLVLRYAA